MYSKHASSTVNNQECTSLIKFEDCQEGANRIKNNISQSLWAWEGVSWYTPPGSSSRLANEEKFLKLPNKITQRMTWVFRLDF
jgi:hypothetical protein